ncbi:hypothetical protein LTR53_002546 [Teratosphaeriaceae sp. CCFEE 6253]|nr:hypothetical protein LTR53_002546 [Teratosphaeriaceae sp. CCFEE 6253]
MAATLPSTRSRMSAYLDKQLKTLKHANNPSTTIPLQSSPLFRLPRELRDQTYTHVFHLSSNPTPHFHIYDSVLTSSTYDPSTPTRRSHRAPARTALLRTSKLVCAAATEILYETTHFDLVILAGHARPHGVKCERTGAVVRLRDRTSLGTLAQCGALLRRIRHATLVIQLVGNPTPSAMRSAMGGGVNLRTLGIKFNIGHSVVVDVNAASVNGLTKLVLHPEGLEALDLVFAAFDAQLVPRVGRRVDIKVVGGPDRDGAIDQGIADLFSVLGLGVPQVGPGVAGGSPFVGEMREVRCLKRGALGGAVPAIRATPSAPRPQPVKRSAKEKCARGLGYAAMPWFVARHLVMHPVDLGSVMVLVFMAPVLVPCGVAKMIEEVLRRRAKGERLIAM